MKKKPKNKKHGEIGWILKTYAGFISRTLSFRCRKDSKEIAKRAFYFLGKVVKIRVEEI